MTDHLAVLEKVYRRMKEGDFYSDYDEASALLGEFREAISAIALMRGQSEVVYQMMAVVGDEHDDPDLWMDCSRESYEKLSGRTDIRARIVYVPKQEPAE